MIKDNCPICNDKLYKPEYEYNEHYNCNICNIVYYTSNFYCYYFIKPYLIWITKDYTEIRKSGKAIYKCNGIEWFNKKDLKNIVFI